MATHPSKTRFTKYLETVRERTASGELPTPHGRSSNPKKLGDRQRSSWELFREFLSLTSKHRRQIVLALGLLTLGTGLRVVPPDGTKPAVDFESGTALRGLDPTHRTADAARVTATAPFVITPHHGLSP